MRLRAERADDGGVRGRRLSASATAMAAFVILSLLLSAIYCAFPWGMGRSAG